MIEKQEKLRVLQIMSGYGGGISSFIKNKAEKMPNYDIIFDVVTYDDCPEDFTQAIEATGGYIYHLQNPKTAGWSAFKRSYTTVLDRHEYDVIYCNINGYRALPYALLARPYKVAKFYIHAHNSADESALSAKQKFVLHQDQRINRTLSDAILGCGVKANRGIFGQKIDASEMMVIPNSIDEMQFLKTEAAAQIKRADHRQKLGLSHDELVIGHIGRLKSVKNHQLTLKLAEYMKVSQLSGRILIIGTGELESALKKQVVERGLEQQILFTGRISPISEFYPALDAVILPSFSEGLPTVVVEAQAAGVPVVVSDVVTDEADLELGMVKALSIDADMADWYSAIVNLTEQESVSTEERSQALRDNKFTNDASAALYVQFLQGQVNHYLIKE